LTGAMLAPPAPLAPWSPCRKQPGRQLLAATAAVLVARWARGLCQAFEGASALYCPYAFTLFPKSYLNRSSNTPASVGAVVRDLKVIVCFAAAGYVVCYSRQRFMGAPYVPQMKRGGLPTPSSGALLAAGLYGANIAYNVLNKRVLMAYPHPLVVTTLNLCTCSLCCLVACFFGVHTAPPRLARTCVKLLPLMVFHWAGILLANVSVSEVNISFTHTVKSAEPVFTAIFATLICGTATSSRGWLCLTLVCAGVALATTTELSFTWVGFWAAMASNVSVSLRSVLSKKILDDHTVEDPLGLTMLLHCGAFVISLAVALASEPAALLSVCWTSVATSALAVGPLVWVFNVASFMILTWASPVTHSMIRALRRPMVVVASIVAFGTAVRPTNLGGIAAALIGAWLYNTSTESKKHLSHAEMPLPSVPSQLLRVNSV